MREFEMVSFVRKIVVAAAAAVACAGASAALPTGTLSYVTPTGTVAPNETVDVWVRLTLDPNSAPLTFSTDPATQTLVGFDPADLPKQGTYFDPDAGVDVTSDFVSYTGAGLNTIFYCTDTFTSGCNTNQTNYSFSFFTTSQPGKPSVNFVDHFDLAPGQSYDYVFGQFKPAAGGASPGTYSLFGTGLFLFFNGTDAAGHAITADLFLTDTTIARTCPDGDTPACAFTRTVTAVPEPASGALMALGLGLFGWLRLRTRA